MVFIMRLFKLPRVLYCIVLYCIVLYCIVLYCISIPFPPPPQIQVMGYNSDIYGNFTHASYSTNGLAVISLLAMVGDGGWVMVVVLGGGGVHCVLAGSGDSLW